MAERIAGAPRGAMIEAAAGLVLIVLAFAAIAASDVSEAGTHVYWLVLVGLSFVAAFAADRLHSDHKLTDPGSALTIVLHWIGVLVAIQLIYFFVGTGRMANADLGLSNGVILALGLFTAGVHGSWRLMVVGVALALASAAVAFMEEYMWVMFALALLAVVILFYGGRWLGRARRGAGTAP